MNKDEIRAFVNSIRSNNHLDLTNGVISNDVRSELVSYYNSHNRALFYEKILPQNSSPEALIINFHGGGFVKGLTTRDRIYASELSLNTKSEVWNAEYSLSPEEPYPAPLEDGYDLLKLAFKEKKERGLPLFIIGHSAGAWITVSVSVLLKQKGQENPIDGVIIDYPPLDVTRSFIERVPEDNEELIKFANVVDIFTEAYKPSKEKTNSLSSPLYAKDEELSEFPKALITVGEQDFLSIENEAFAKRLKELGKDVEIKIYKDSGHSFTTNKTGLYKEALSDHYAFINGIIKATHSL